MIFKNINFLQFFFHLNSVQFIKCMFFETFFYLSFFDIFGCGFSRSVKKSLSSDNFQGSGILGGVGGVNSSTVKHKVGQGLAQSSLVVPSTKASRKQSKANMEDNSKSFLREKLELKDQLSWNTFYHVCDWNTFYHVCEEVFWSNINCV